VVRQMETENTVTGMDKSVCKKGESGTVLTHTHLSTHLPTATFIHPTPHISMNELSLLVRRQMKHEDAENSTTSNRVRE
jgi:hypothetical protein